MVYFMDSQPPDIRNYTIGWLCALPVELAAGQIVLDATHAELPRNARDDTQYTLGRIGNYGVVMACLSAGQLGVGPASAIAARMRTTFPNLQFGLMVGIGGGVPSSEDVRLGDVVVSRPVNGYGGVVQYDFGKFTLDGFVPSGFLNSPPQALLKGSVNLQARISREESDIMSHLALFANREKFRRPDPDSDVLFKPTYNHSGKGKTCELCDLSETVSRPLRPPNSFAIHYGNIASGNSVIKNAKERDATSARFGGVLCFEMEAAGIMNVLPCLVIRGICDYADSHKNKAWQPYAAATAAAYAKELLSVLAPIDLKTPDCTEPLGQTEMPREILVKESSTAVWLKSVAPQTSPEENLRMCLSFAQRSNISWCPWPMDCSRLFKDLKTWLATPGALVLVVRGTQGAQDRTKYFAAYVTSFLKSFPGQKVIWALSFGSFGRSESVVDGLKSLLYQAIRHDPNLKFPEEAIKRLQRPYGEEILYELIGIAFSQLSECFVVVECKNRGCTARLRRLVQDECNPKIKVLLVDYGFLPLEPRQTDPNAILTVVPKAPASPRMARLQRAGVDRWKDLHPEF